LKCVICKQGAGFIYPLFNLGRCVSCKLNIESALDTTPLSKEWLRHNEISKKAVEKYLKEKQSGVKLN
jgi:hypothetical protein